MHIPKEYCALLSYTHFLSMVCKGYIWQIHDALETRLIRCCLDCSGLILRIKTSEKKMQCFPD
jgi:hypothetical protein